jgi:sterol desaturase/sphingolipid hydroxylase (fatty acid hydroxylase superfamily)
MIEQFLAMERDQLIGFFLSPGSRFSIAALFISLVAALFYLRKQPEAQSLSSLCDLRRLLSGGVPRHEASHRLDMAYFLISLFLAALFLSGAVLSYDWLAQTLYRQFDGQAPLAATPPWLAMVIATLTLALVFEWAYWFDHMLCHKLPWLWRFHSIHHSAESLSLLTVFRVHPVDTIVYYNVLALFSGLATAGLWMLFGKETLPFTLYGTNVIVLIGGIVLGNLHHSHLWLKPPGWLAHILLGPAHHQIHHSKAPDHHDRNLGNLLSLFDRAFGTYFEPPAERPALCFGLATAQTEAHQLLPSLLRPFLALLPLPFRAKQNRPLKSDAQEAT